MTPVELRVFVQLSASSKLVPTTHAEDQRYATAALGQFLVFTLVTIVTVVAPLIYVSKLPSLLSLKRHARHLFFFFHQLITHIIIFAQ